MPGFCVWPVAWGVACREATSNGKLCPRHRQRVQAQAGKLDCAWPSCERPVWDQQGLCSFHRQVAEVVWA